MEIESESFADAYNQIRLAFISGLGREVSPRTKPTVEIVNVNICISNPRSRLGYHPKRNFSLPYAVTEAIALFMQTNRVQYLAYVLPKMLEYSDDGVFLNGSYGYRIADHIVKVVVALQLDKDTRRMVLPLYKESDIGKNSLDIPCTLSLQFLVRDNKLHLFTTMRSGDFYLGLPYDIFQFTVLQEVIANELGISLGNYYHRVTSLHYYLTDEEKVFEIDHLEPVEFAAPYTLATIEPLIENVKQLEQVIPLGYTTGGPFAEILRRFAMKKRKIAIKDAFPQEMSWANQFMKVK